MQLVFGSQRKDCFSYLADGSNLLIRLLLFLQLGESNKVMPASCPQFQFIKGHISAM